MTLVALDDIAELVGRQAETRPHAPAVVLDDHVLSYADLTARADLLAGSLRAAGVGPGNVVPVVLPPSGDLVVAVLAVLKTGAAYAALDPTWPEGRLRRIAGLLDRQVAITGPAAVPGFPSRLVIGLGAEVSAPPPAIVGTGVAMVFFTSGTTGEPKAVLAPHRAVARLFVEPTFARFDPTTVMAQTSAMPWDAFALEVWGPLVTGGSCVVHTERPLTPAGLRGLVRRGVNTVFLTTSLFHLIVEDDVDAFAGLTTVMVGGEKLSARHAARFRACRPRVRLVNGYGPVESAVFVLTHEVGDADGEVPLGRPVPRTSVVVLRDGVSAPPGEVGELCVAGDGLAVGYLGDPELTAAKFRTVDIEGVQTRVYRTGDLGVIDADGVAHYRGRMDRQIKRRGHRIEPAGVEAVAAALPAVGRCAAVPRFDDNGNCVELVLCYVPSGAPGDVASELARSLPAQAAPDRVVAVPRFPLSANGKLDVRALLAALPVPVDGELATDTERAVAAEVRALVGAVDRSTPLRELGVSSLAAIRLCARLGARFDRTIPVSRVAASTTIAELADWIDRSPAAPVAADSPTAPLTPMQHGFVLRHLAEVHDTDNHCVLTWTITGALDPDRLAAAVATVHARHGYLSGRYRADTEATVTASGLPVAFERHDSGLLAERLGRPFDLAAGSVWRSVLVGSGDSWRFGVAVHHAAFDGWSQHVLADELTAAYAGEPMVAPPSPAQAVVDPGDLDDQRRFWRAELADLPELAWPEGDMDGPDFVEVPAPAASLSLLLTAAHAAIAGTTGQDRFGVGVPVNHRGSVRAQRVIGCLIDMVCVPLRAGQTDPSAALANADLPFAEVVRLVRPRRTGRHPLYQAIVALQDSPLPALRLDGCVVGLDPRPPASWSHTELVVELFTHERRLRVTRDPGRVSAATMRGVARTLATILAT
ncbi:amino acid adenylation domain-containing protein [Actinokineospora sp. HUAS TT18]|uniref:amino acid adenylation domain-containing protein n=1 Tax=Actinokineospora sp. HUAS TT18 TaxID=3447451 RepID=UPI003F51C6C4